MHGYAPRYGVEEQPLEEFLPHRTLTEEMPERNQEIIKDIVSICKENNVDLILVRTPQKDWTYEQHCEVETLAQTFGVPFIDYNLLLDEIELESCDFSDVNHLNANGADKVSKHIGKYLEENYSFDVVEDEDLWNSDYEKYLEYDEKRCRDAGFPRNEMIQTEDKQ